MRVTACVLLTTILLLPGLAMAEVAPDAAPADHALRTILAQATEDRATGAQAPLRKTKKKKKGKKKAKNAIEFDIDDAPNTRFELAPGLTFGALIENETDYEHNFDLDDGVDDARLTTEPGLELALDYIPHEMIEAFVNLRLAYDAELVDEDGKKNDNAQILFEQFNLTLRDAVDGVSLKVGRQRMKDAREWLYDDELDAAVLYLRRGIVGLEASISRLGLVDANFAGEDDDDDTVNYMLYGHIRPHKDHTLGAYAIARDDLSGRDEFPIFFGLRGMGEITKRLEYWVDAAVVTGQGFSGGDNKDLLGFGIDLGGTYVADTDLEPSITLGFAFGSGDSDPADGTDNGFRQTGLHDNSGRFNGVTKFRYYGELFDPELSNMSILTAGFGLRPFKRASVDLVYHFYWRNDDDDGLRDRAINQAASGTDDDLGQELDLVLGINTVKRLKFTTTLGYFLPGGAYPDGADPAWLATLEIRYRF